MLSRLLGLAQKHESAVLFLTQSDRDAPSVDPLVGMRAWASAERVSEGSFVLSVRALKDKRRAPGWERREVFRGPAGLR
jgi:recombination protein RecA